MKDDKAIEHKTITPDMTPFAWELCFHCGGTYKCNCSTCGYMKLNRSEAFPHAYCGFGVTSWVSGDCVVCKAKKVQ